MKIKLLGNTQCPKFGRDGDAGYDLFLNADVKFPPHTTTVVDTGVCVELPKGHAGLLAMRSGVCKTGLIIQQPLIDENYRGELHGILYNDSFFKTIKFKKGERVFSLYVFPVYQEDVEVVEALSETNRGNNWNGSSGK
jgi:dUTP pyrophosphatase